MATAKWTAAEIPSQAGKTALVTGANSGIGYQAALELARHGAHVLLGCRSAAKGATALAKLMAEAPGASAEVVSLDMASLASVRAFAAGFAARGVKLDLLINNAGVMALPMCRRDIGDYLGLTLETVSRSLSALADKGALSFNGSRQIMLNNRARLQAMTE